MPRIAYTVRQIMEDVQGAHESSISEKGAQQILRRRVLEWAFSVYECTTSDDLLGVMGRRSQWSQCGVLCRDSTPCYQNRIPNHLHCADHVKTFYGSWIPWLSRDSVERDKRLPTRDADVTAGLQTAPPLERGSGAKGSEWQPGCR